MIPVPVLHFIHKVLHIVYIVLHPVNTILTNLS